VPCTDVLAVSDRPFNADGFGIGWYEAKDESHAAQLLSTTPPTDARRNSSGSKISSCKSSDVAAQRMQAEAEERERPCVFKSIHPVRIFLYVSRTFTNTSCKAWSNANLNRLAEKIRSPLVFAHVRASTMPGAREFASSTLRGSVADLRHCSERG
jgi:glutamine amidotransferase